MNDDKMLEMRLRRMAERQGVLLEKARSLAARQVAQYHLIRGTEVLGVGGVKLAEIERQLPPVPMRDETPVSGDDPAINATPINSERDVA